MNTQHENQVWLDYLLSTQWTLPVAGGLARGPFRQASADTFLFHDLSFSRAALLAAAPADLSDIETVERFDAIHQGWRIAPFQKFQPLIYYCAFGPQIIIDSLVMSIRSLRDAGAWRHRVLVLTAPAQVQAVRAALEPLGFGGRLAVAGVTPAADLLDWCLARYRLEAHPWLATCRPLLYLDADIMGNASLDALLLQLQTSSRVHARLEGRLGEGSLESDGRWFGWRLLAADNVAFDRDAPGFSAGALGVAGPATARRAYDLILRSCYGHAEAAGRRLPPYDQAVAGYALRKLDMIDLTLMTRHLVFCRVDHWRAEMVANVPKLGLVHFTGGDFGQKYQAMRDYAAFIGIGGGASFGAGGI